MTILVLLPGLDGTGDLFDPFVDALAGQFRIEIVRYPTKQILDYQELLAFTRRTLPVDEPYVVLGESFSGPLAIALAAEHHPKLMGIVLCSTFARNPRPGLMVFEKLLSWIPFGWLPSLAIRLLLLGSFSTAPRCRAVAQAVGKVAPAVLRARVRAVLKVEVSDLLSSVRIPCIYLRPTQDRLIPDRAVAHIRSVLRSLAVIRINAPHCLLQAAPGEAAAAVSSFIRGLNVGP